MLASPDKPMPEASQRSQVARMWEGLRNIESAPEPTRYDWSVVFDALRLMEALIEQKTWKMADGSMADVVDTNGLLEDAITGVAIAGARHMQDGKTIRLDARYIVSVRGILEDYEAIMAQLTHRDMIRAHRLAEKRRPYTFASVEKAAHHG